MRIHLFFINWNDSFYLPFIKQNYHYCEKIVMMDNHSGDNSVSLAKSLGMEVRTFGQMGQLNDQHYLDVKNHVWKESRESADYVIVCDADEFLIGDVSKLTSSLPKVQGYNMVSDSLDLPTINTGYEDQNYSKRIIFDPKRINEINYVHGAHKCNPQGNITEHDQLSLYHYRCIGGFQRLYERHLLYQNRMSKFNRKHGMGHHYLVTEAQKRIEWNHMKEKAYELY
jgi:hypothetical protein